MAAYLTKLWDDMAKIVLTNTKDIDARDSNYDQRVAAVVWQTVRKLRAGRQIFRLEIQNELKAARSTKR